MNEGTITVAATLRADGKTLELDERLSLPPGRVTVSLQSVPCAEITGPTVLEVLDRIHREQRERGDQTMTEEQMAAEIASLRADGEEEEERWRQIWAQTTSPAVKDKP